MIIYQSTKGEFLDQVANHRIEETVQRHYRASTGATVAPAEIQAWRNSLTEMFVVLQDSDIPPDVTVAIEYQIPNTSKRIDFIVSGVDERAKPCAVIVELKQWSTSRRSEADGLIWAHRGGRRAEQEGPHPSYQAWTYAALLRDFNTGVQEGDIRLSPCAYLHNHPRNGEIDHPHYKPHIERAPLFLADDRKRLQAFIRQHVRAGDQGKALYQIEHGRIRPSKSLAEAVTSMMQGKAEFLMIDDQKLVYERVIAAVARASDRKRVILVRGGPGTGKSVVAINLLAEFMRRRVNARYVSKNAAPRAVYEQKLTGAFRRTQINNLFSGSGSYIDVQPNSFDVLLVDEAHRLNLKSGLYANLGENQIKELLNAAASVVFFLDEDQRVTIDDIGSAEEIKRWADHFQAEVEELELASQFRCSGSDGYLAWLDNTLDIRPTANTLLDSAEFDFRVFDSPVELHEAIKIKNALSNRARVVAGYCWPWPSKKDPAASDIVLEKHGYRKQWNLSTDGSLWIIAPESVEQVGCIHTCQGLEVDYVGVIIGPDMSAKEGRIVTDVTERASSDRSVRGMRKRLKESPESAKRIADQIIKNTYRTLMTRGMRGCYVYCTDAALRDYLRSRLQQRDANADEVNSAMDQRPVIRLATASVIPLRLVSAAARSTGVPAIPVVDLKIAAGLFSASQSFDEAATAWVEPPDWVRPQPGLFVAQVSGESMNRRIPNGSWCLFRAEPAGTRQGKVVVVEHRGISDPETGGRYTVKVYSSRKVAAEDGGWQHERITLSPDSDDPSFQPIEIVRSDGDDFRVIAELLAVVSE